MVLDKKFQDLGAAADRLYKIADWAELCRNEAMQKDVSEALDQILGEFQSKLDTLISAYGEGS